MTFLEIIVLPILLGTGGFFLFRKKLLKLRFQPPRFFPKPVAGPEKPEVGPAPAATAPRSPEAENRAREIILSAKNEVLRIKEEAQKEALHIRSEAVVWEGRLRVREETLSEKLKEAESRNMALNSQSDQLQKKLAEIDQIKSDQIAKLERAAGLSKDEASKLILDAVEKNLEVEIGKKLKRAEEVLREQVEKKTKELLIDALAHAGTDFVIEHTVSKVRLPDDELKGRIIGKEGRNIKTFEQLTGVDVDLDETPGEIRLSSFDPVRREVARIAMERLITDGRIQPVRIEEIVGRTQSDVEKIMTEAGEWLAKEIGVFNLQKELLTLLGRFKYRTSYGQNMIQHTLEETKLGVHLAKEFKADAETVRLGCLFHDIGKVVAEEEGTHVSLGADLLRRYRFPPAVIDAVESHHEDKPFSSLEAVIVYLADAISAARPGARFEDYEEYVKRMSDLETTALSFDGVKNAYAVAAGRELRVIVSSEKTDDARVAKLAHDIAEKIEKELTYPAEVKVTVIREVKAVGVAR